MLGVRAEQEGSWRLHYRRISLSFFSSFFSDDRGMVGRRLAVRVEVLLVGLTCLARSGYRRRVESLLFDRKRKFAYGASEPPFHKKRAAKRSVG